MNDLTHALDVSLSAVREGLSRLASDGFVVMQPQKGFSVAPVSSKELQDLTQARIEIEQLCLHQSILQGSLDWETGVLAAHHQLSRIEPFIGDSREINPEWTTAHDRFHEALVAGCANDVLLRIRRMLYVQAERYRYWSASAGSARPRDVRREHKGIMEAVIARDADRARKLIRQHIEKTSQVVSELRWDSELEQA